MKKSELDVATNVVRDAISMYMRKAGFSDWVGEIEKHKDQLRDIVQYGLQAAEDERKRIEKEEKK